MADHYLVTGGAGFIGSNIVHELVKRGERVTVVDNFITGKKENLSGLENAAEIVEADIRDTGTMRKLLKNVTYVLHQAALPSVPRSVENPWASNDHNINGTLSLLLAARDAGVKRLVAASSSSVYGDQKVSEKSEDLPVHPLSPYALTKYASEQYTRIFSSLYQMETVVLRYFNVFGPRQNPKSEYAAVIPKFITMMLRGEQPTIYGDGTQSRDFTYVSNNVSANLRACTAEGVSGEVFNIALGKRISLNGLVDELNVILGTTITPHYAAARPGDIKHSLADIRRAQERLGYTVAEDFSSGLRKTVAWYKERVTQQ